MHRDDIVRELNTILRSENVITDEAVLKESSNDRYRKYEQVCGVYTQPIPAAGSPAISSSRSMKRLRR